MLSTEMDHFADENTELDILLESNCSPLRSVLKHFDMVSVDMNNPYSEKVNALVILWETIIEFIVVQPSFKLSEEVFKYAYPQTISIILYSGWLNVDETFKQRLKVTFEKCLVYFMEFNSISVINIKSLIKLVENPWDDPMLKRIINNHHDVSQKELADFFKTENILLISTRIKVLSKSNSEDLALQLANAAVKFSGISPSSWIDAYIRVITNNINNVERWKVQNDVDRLREAEIRLSELYLLLMDVLKDHIGISRELVLTAFSLNPTQECYSIIRHYHRRSDMINPNTSKFDLKAISPETGKVMTKSPIYNPFKATNHILEACEKIGLSADTTSDLVAIITSQRYKKLSWMHGWKKLKHDCLNYIRNGVAMRNENKELKYLKIDYSMFK